MDPVTLGLICAAVIGGFFVYSQNADATSSGSDNSVPIATSLGDGSMAFQNALGLWDVSPSNQGGYFLTDYDDSILKASVQTGMPFALIKAHAIAESSLRPGVTKAESNNRMSYGLTQILWWANSNRFAQWGYPDDQLAGGQKLFDTDINCYLGACIMKDNFTRLKNLKDAINAYNTGVKISVRAAPADYVAKVSKYYSTLTGVTI